MRELPSVFGGPETLVAAVHARLLGDLGGAMLFAAPRMGSLALVDMMHNRPVGTRKSFGQAEEALFTQVASIMFSAYLASVGRLADLSLLPGTPSFALDMAGAVLQAITSEVGMMGSSAILIRARFFERESPVDMHLLFLPDAESLEVLLGRLGLT
jgi:chemotaxis protein CheY-P-specific phosphatase CheC